MALILLHLRFNDKARSFNFFLPGLRLIKDSLVSIITLCAYDCSITATGSQLKIFKTRDFFLCLYWTY